MPPHVVILDVSGRKFRTQKVTLQTSPFFTNLLARWDDCSDRQEDGSYFIDADADIFQHILNFMRRPSKFPLFWTKETSFDYALYNILEAEADYFLLHDLRDWIRAKRYLDAIKVAVEVKTLAEHELKDGRNQKRCEADIEVQTHLGHYSGEKYYLCPRGLHNGNPRACGSGHSDCMEITRTHVQQYNNPSNKLTMVIKTVTFDETVCVNDRSLREG